MTESHLLVKLKVISNVPFSIPIWYLCHLTGYHHLLLYLNSCSLTTSPRYSMMNCPAFRGSLVLIPQPFSSARNRSRHCTHSCLCILWLQHCSPQGQVLGEHSAKIIRLRQSSTQPFPVSSSGFLQLQVVAS